MVKIGILGYGNLGKGVEAAIKKNADMELVAVYTRRDPATLTINTEGVPVKSTADLDTGKEALDVLIICGGSATDLPEMTPKYAAMYNVIDSFDTHAKVPVHFANVDKASKQAGKIGIISCGWDPGMFSISRVYAHAVLPDGKDYTFWGKGVSQGHSDAVRRIDGVLDARQYTVPVPEALDRVRSGEDPELTTREKHTRECFVVAEEGADLARIENEIKTMPNYFRSFYHDGRDEGKSQRTAARRLRHLLRREQRRHQACDRIQPQARLQPRIHRLGSGRLRESGGKAERRGRMRRQDGV